MISQRSQAFLKSIIFTRRLVLCKVLVKFGSTGYSTTGVITLGDGHLMLNPGFLSERRPTETIRDYIEQHTP